MRLDAKLKLGATDIPNLQDRPDELPFMLASRHILHQTLVALWEDQTAPKEVLVARSDWLWSALRQEQPMRVLPGGDDSGRLLASLNIAALMASVPHLGSGPWKKALPHRQALMDWLNATAVSPRADGGAEAFLDLIAQHLASLADNAEAHHLAAALDIPVAEAEQHLGLHRRRLFELASEPIQQRLLAMPDFMTDTGVGALARVSMNGVDFPPQALWTAMGRALRNGGARVRSLGGMMLTLKRCDDGLAMSGALQGRIREPWFPVLAVGSDQRAEPIEAYLAARDLAPADLERLTAEALAAVTEGDLVEVLQEARQGQQPGPRSTRLSEALKPGTVVPRAIFLPPPAERLAHHLRLGDLERPVADQALEGWRDLTARAGPRAALPRLGGLPLPLSDTIREVAADLDQLGTPQSPVAHLHVAAAAFAAGDSPRAEGHLAAVIGGMSTTGQLLPVLLTWTARAFTMDAAWRAMPSGHQMALVWSHAHRLMTILLERSSDPAPPQQYFEQSPAPQDLGARFWRSPEVEADCGAPSPTYASSLVYHGLAYVFGAADVFAAAPGEAR